MSEDKRKSGGSKKSMVAPGGASSQGQKPQKAAEPTRPSAPKASSAGGSPPSGGAATGSGGSSGGKGLGILAILLALVAVGGVAYVWTETAGGRAGTATRLDTAVSQGEANATQLSELTSGQSALREELESLRSSVGENLANYADTQKKDAESTQSALGVLNQEVDARIAALKEELIVEIGQRMSNQQQAQQSTQAGLDDFAKETRDHMEDQGKALQSSLDEAQNQLGMLRNEVAASEEKLERSIGEQIDRLQSQLDTIVLAQRGLNRALELVKETVASGGDKNAWTLSEVGYLLQMADYRLRYQEDVDGALAALSLAQERLKTVDELAFAPVLSAIAEQISALRGVRSVDRTALSQQLASLANEASTLPLRNEARTAAIKQREAQKRAGMKAEVDMDQEDWLSEAADSAWEEIKKLVVVRHERRTMPPLIAPEEEFYLAQNLALKVEVARIAVLREDGAVFQDSLSMALDWIDSYFDTANERVVTVTEELRRLQQVELHPYIPDVSRVSRAFQEVMDTRKPLKTMPDAESEQTAVDEGGAA